MSIIRSSYPVMGEEWEMYHLLCSQWNNQNANMILHFEQWNSVRSIKYQFITTNTLQYEWNKLFFRVFTIPFW